MKSRISEFLLVVGIVGLAVLTSGCIGDTGGEGGKDDAAIGTQYVPDAGQGASLEISVNRSVSTCSETGFTVTAKDPFGDPLEYFRIYCNSETGVGLTEPTSNFFLTGAAGVASGSIACLSPGSWVMECRATDSAITLVDRLSIRCTGAVDPGCDGYPGAGGQTLGGGSLDDQTPDIGDGVRISLVEFEDIGGRSINAVLDNFFNPDCDGDATTVDPEPFSDKNIYVTVTNGTFQRLFIDSWEAVVTIDGATYATIPAQAVTDEVTPRGAGSFVSTFVTNAGGQRFVGTSTTVADAVYGVRLIVRGTAEDGTAFAISNSTSVTFQPVNNCAA